MFHAWHVATFATHALVGKLKPLATVLAPFGSSNVTPITKEGLEAAMKSIGLKGRPVSEAAMQAFLRTKES